MEVGGGDFLNAFGGLLGNAYSNKGITRTMLMLPVRSKSQLFRWTAEQRLCRRSLVVIYLHHGVLVLQARLSQPACWLVVQTWFHLWCWWISELAPFSSFVACHTLRNEHTVELGMTLLEYSAKDRWEAHLSRAWHIWDVHGDPLFLLAGFWFKRRSWVILA